MKRFNIMNSAGVQGAQAAIDDQYQRQINEARFKSVRDYQAGQQAKNQFGGLANQLMAESGRKGLDPTIADAYRQQASMYRALASQLQYTDPDKYGETIQRFMASVEDPRKLANELRRSQIAADAEITKANIYAGANGGGTTFGNQLLTPTPQVAQKAGSLYDLVGGLFGGNKSQGQ